jgi:hypothetical protein
MEISAISLTEARLIYKLDYPFASILNSRLHKIIVENATLSDRGAMQTDWFSQFEEFKLVAAYVKTFLQLPSYQPGDHQTVHDHLPCHWAFVYYVNTPKNSPPLIFDDCCFSYYPVSGQILVFPASMRHHVPTSQVSGRSNVVGNFYFQTDPTAFPLLDDA